MKVVMWRKWVLVVVGVVVLTGCGLLGDDGGDDPAGSPPPVADMLPVLDGYNTIEGETLTGYISTLAGGASLLALQPELTATIAAVDGVITCYQQVGAARARVYSKEDAPLTAGTVAIADRNALLDPANLFSCLLAPRGPATGFEPCTASYTLPRDDNEFYIVYAGTTPDMCEAFCSQLEGCTAH